MNQKTTPWVYIIGGAALGALLYLVNEAKSSESNNSEINQLTRRPRDGEPIIVGVSLDTDTVKSNDPFNVLVTFPTSEDREHQFRFIPKLKSIFVSDITSIEITILNVIMDPQQMDMVTFRVRAYNTGNDASTVGFYVDEYVTLQGKQRHVYSTKLPTLKVNK